jgi:transposase
MPQIQLPFFPEGVTHITPMLAFSTEDGRITYFNGNMPVFVHNRGDIATFRMITAQFCVNGNTKQSDIAKAFGIPLVTVKRAVKLYRQEGPKGFYAQRKTRGAAVLTAPVLAEAQELLDEGLEPSAVAERLSIKPDTLSKAVRAGRLRQRAKKKTFSPS